MLDVYYEVETVELITIVKTCHHHFVAVDRTQAASLQLYVPLAYRWESLDMIT